MPERDTPKGIVEELRSAAELEAAELRIPVEESQWSDAADLVEELLAALERIAGGAENPQAIAREAIDPLRRIFSSSESPARSSNGSSAAPRRGP